MLDRYNIIDERDVHAAGQRLQVYHEERARQQPTAQFVQALKLVQKFVQ
jgi:hypothetical protein